VCHTCCLTRIIGVISLASSYRYTKELMVANTSEIPMRFSWRVPADTAEDKEFQIIPQKGSILPGGKQKIGIEFVSQTVQRYNQDLVMDIPMVRSRRTSLGGRARTALRRKEHIEAITVHVPWPSPLR